ncbi:MAG: hypothetical protein EBT02_07510 [Planctomycetia bacterium]|nr:hypothetical protein [Planctomycetia bacterium]
MAKPSYKLKPSRATPPLKSPLKMPWSLKKSASKTKSFPHSPVLVVIQVPAMAPLQGKAD